MSKVVKPHSWIFSLTFLRNHIENFCTFIRLFVFLLHKVIKSHILINELIILLFLLLFFLELLPDELIIEGNSFTFQYFLQFLTSLGVILAFVAKHLSNVWKIFHQLKWKISDSALHIRNRYSDHYDLQIDYF